MESLLDTYMVEEGEGIDVKVSRILTPGLIVEDVGWAHNII